MTKEEKEKLREVILSEKDNILANMESLEEGAKPVAPDEAIGRLTRMEAINAKGITEANLNAAKVKLAKLDRALAKLDDADFGTCAICEEQIPAGRIMLMPETTVCVQCADR